MIDLRDWTAYPVTKKLWGEERLLINADYCAKLLIIQPGFACSLHRHVLKDETFFVVDGMAAIEWGIDPSILRIEHKAVGDCLRMQAGTYHRFWSAVDRPTVLLEVSSHHDDGDVERLQESAPL